MAQIVSSTVYTTGSGDSLSQPDAKQIDEKIAAAFSKVTERLFLRGDGDQYPEYYFDSEARLVPQNFHLFVGTAEHLVEAKAVKTMPDGSVRAWDRHGTAHDFPADTPSYTVRKASLMPSWKVEFPDPLLRDLFWPTIISKDWFWGGLTWPTP